jgi:hypothetical protein
MFTYFYFFSKVDLFKCLLFYFVLMFTCSEDIIATVAPGGELGVVARAAIDSVGLRSELEFNDNKSLLLVNGI